MSYKNVDQFIHQTGGRPRTRGRCSQWLLGAPFTFTVAMVTAAATEVDLTTAAILSSDPLVETAFGTADVPKAVLRIEGWQLVITDDAFRIATDVDKEAMYQQLRIRHKDGSNTRLYGLGGSIYEPWSQSLEVAAAAAAVSIAVMQNRPIRLNQPIEVDLERDEFAIAAHAATLGAAYNCTLKVWGHMFPENEERHKGLKGGRCKHGDGLDTVDVVEIEALQTTLRTPMLLDRATAAIVG